MRERERRKALSPGSSYVPNGKSQDFIEMVGSGKHVVNLFCAANGVGKSCSGANILANIIFGPQSNWFKSGEFTWTDEDGVAQTRKAVPMTIFEQWPYPKRARIISDPTTIKSKIIPELEKWFPVNEVKAFPEAMYELGKEGKNYVCKIQTKTGWTIDIMSTEQDSKEFESADISLVWIDEPIPKDKFMATLARGRLGLIVIWTFTPLTFSAWIKEWMDEHADGEYCDYVEAEMEDNCKIHGVRGILEHANIERVVSGMSEDEKEARAFGRFGHLIGRVHKLFKRKIHVVEPFPLDEKLYATYKALDPHARTADHCLYLSVNSRRQMYITGEVISEGGTRALYERMKSFENVMHYRIEGRLIDPSAYNTDQHKDEGSVGEQLEDMGERYVKGSKDMMAGIKRTNDALFYELREGRLIRPPEIYIFSTCVTAIKQLEEYVWQEWKGSAKDSKQANAKPVDRNDHQCENLHRLLLCEPCFVPKKTATKYSSSLDSDYEDIDPYSR